MKKILLFVFIMTALLWYGERTSPPLVFATVVNPDTDCVMSGVGSVFISNTVPTPTPIAGCRFSANVDGLDGGTGITNTTKLTVPAHKTLTIIDEGSNFSTLVVGSMVIEKDASVILPEYVDPETGVKTGSQIMIGAALYLKDEDEDGYPASGEQMAAYAQPSPTPGYWKRKNTITTLTVDCDDTDATRPNPNPCRGDVSFTTGDFERGKNIDGASLLQGYYAEIGKDLSLVGLWHLNEIVDKTGTGGTITTSGGYKIHTFTAGGTFTPNFTGTVEYLVVAGGGGGGSSSGASAGGGGAGGVLTGTTAVTAGIGYTVTVGGGGGGGTSGGDGTKGSDSVFNSITAIGGGYGGKGAWPGGPGGSGGGGGTDLGAGGAGTSGQGYAGGTAQQQGNFYAGGGGGAGAVGAGSGALGNGGAGIASLISGSSLYYAGGGGGGSYTGGPASGGSSVGGAGGYASSVNGGAGTTNRGGGGGGSQVGNGGAGGSGVVIVRYAVVSDSSENANHGSLTGTTIVDGLMGKARSFASGNYISIGDNDKLSFPNRIMTVAGWVKTSQTTGSQAIAAKGNTSNWEYALSVNGTVARIDHWNAAGSANDTVIGTTYISDGLWHHVAAVADGFRIYLYVDGKLEGSTVLAQTWTNGTATLNLGRREYGDYFLTGFLDEVAIYNRALSPEEIKAQASRSPWARYTSSVIDMGSARASVPLAWTGLGIGTRTWSSGTLDTTNEGQVPKSSTNLVAQWNFDATSGTAANNDAEGTSCGGTPASCDGTLTTFASTASQDQAVGTGWTLANKRWGAGALMFDGTDDYVSVPDNDSLDFTTAMSISFWLKKGGSTTVRVISKANNSGQQYLWVGQIIGDKLRLNIGNAGSNTAYYVTGNKAINDKDWHFYTITYTGTTSKASLYIDGVLDRTATPGTTDGDSGTLWSGNIEISSGVLTMGKLRVASTDYFEHGGVVDSISLYSRALTASEILSNYQAGNIEFQWRAGSTTTPDSTDYAGTDNWTQWAPVGATSYESQVDAMDSTQASWYWDINAAGNADGATALYVPKTKAQDTTMKTEGTGSMKISLGQPQSDANTVALYHFEETGPGVGVTQFNSSGTYTPAFSGNVEVLVVAGGGGGGGGTYYSGGGGAGGLVSNPSYSVSSETPITVTVGGGGAGGVNTTRGTNGQNSVFGTITAVGGGGGSNYSSGAAYSGGSGGGGSYAYVTGGSPTAEQGYAGGTASQVAPNYGAGGGGGAGAVGGNGTGTTGGKGGDGLIYSGTSQYYAGGGGGSTYSAGTPGAGGKGGGGAGSTGNATSGTANTGGGGGGAERAGTTGGSGGSGVVLVNDGFKLNDSVGTNHGTPNGTTIVDGVFGKGRSFDGSSYITVPDSTSFTFGTGDFSIDLWVKPTTITGSYEGIMGTYTDVGCTGFILTTSYGTDGHIGWWNATNGWIDSNTSLDLNVWNHLAVIRSSGTLNIYKNGMGVSSTPNWSGSIDGCGLWIGKWYSSYAYFNGIMDEIRINKGSAMSANAVYEAYRAGRDHRLSRTISSTPLTNKSKLPFWFASDRLGTYSEMIVGNSAFANYEIDTNTVGLWHLEEQTNSATGGTITTSGGYIIHTFTSSGTFTPTFSGNVEVLVVGGGGGGGSSYSGHGGAGGGGAGGLVYYPNAAVAAGQAYTATVGPGGAGGTASVGVQGTNGSNSVFGSLTATGGGGGGSGYSAGVSTGLTGGSGGAAGYDAYVYVAGAAGTSGQGYAGGGNGATSGAGGGGGGGAGAVGNAPTNSPLHNGGNGGNGLAYAISGTSTYYAGGGGGGGGTVGTGGLGGGGAGAYQAQGGDGTANTGGGGGGTYAAGGRGGNGGSGIVIVRYPGISMSDSSGNANHGMVVGTTFTQGKIGKARSFNGSSDYISIPHASNLAPTSALTLSAWIKPSVDIASGSWFPIIKKDTNSYNGVGYGYVLYYNSSGLLYMTTGTNDDALWDCHTTIATSFAANTWYHIVGVKDSSGQKVYINGQLVSNNTATGCQNNINYSTTTNNVKIGVIEGVPGTQYANGVIDEVRLDNIARTPAQIREAYEVGKRTHQITVDFHSGLVTGALIADVNDLAFSVDETTYGSTAKANHLFVGDKIIVKENVGGTEYIAQGMVATVNSSTGAVTVTAWDSGSTFPSGGFTVNATVFKWQREIMDITGSLPSQREFVTYLTFRPTMSSGATMWIDDIRSGGPYINTSPTTLTPSTASRYFQLRALFSTTDTATSSSLTSMNIQSIPTPLTPTPTPGCQIGCYKCSEGSAVPVTAGSDDNDFCQPITCSGRTWGWGTVAPVKSCMEADAATINGTCNGEGACYTAFASVCKESTTTLASCGSEECIKACVQDTSSTLYDTAGEICYTDFSTQTCPDGKRCNATGTCVTCSLNGTVCTVNGECCTGTCTTFYQDSDGDSYGNASVSTKRCGTTYAGYVTNSTDCNDTGTSSANVWISATCYVDSDNDNYGSTTAKSCTNNATCGSATWASGANGTVAASGNFSANNTDCCDTDATAYPGSTVCKTTPRTTCGGYDYNCSGGNTYCGTTYYSLSGAFTCDCSASRCGACNTAYASRSQVGCGVGGDVTTTYVIRLVYGGSPAACYAMDCGGIGYAGAGTQGCQ